MKYDRTKRHHVAGLLALRARVRFKSTPSVPTPAAPQTVATAQTGSNVDTAVANATLGNVNQNGPLGSTTYNQTGSTNVDGNIVPSFTQTTNLNPTLQSILSGTENAGASLMPTAQTLATNAGTSATTPLNFSGANENIIQGGPQALDTNAANSIFGGQMAMLQPGLDLQKQQLQDQLSRQGIPVGSDAYNSAMTQFGTTENQATLGAAGQATGQGITSANNMYNLALLGQNQQIGQQQTAQSNPLDLLSKLYSTGTTSTGAAA